MKDIDFLIVEDDYLIAVTIAELLQKSGYTSIRIASSVDEAVLEINTRKPGLVLTDINLESEKSGIDLGQLLLKKFLIPFIYITSHSSPEILDKAKHTRPNAYIVKPFKNEDLIVAIELALFNSFENLTPDLDSPEIIVKEGRSVVRLICDEIVWLESDSNYVVIHLSNVKRRVIRITLTELVQQLPQQYFIRIHKSFVINKKFVSEIKTNCVVVRGNEVPIGRAYQHEIERLLK